ncbi:MAG: YeaC family protein [Pseudomonadales bacterium]|nr:YeaC family protein [Pseudomonadales bacterium]
MDFNRLIESITPETYENLKRALELGKWADGTRLTQDQKEQVMQAIIAYGEKNLNEQQRVGFIDRGVKEEGEQCSDTPEESTIKFIQ